MLNNVILRPVVSEKSMKDAAKFRYTFMVEKSATKAKIAETIAKIYNVKPLGVKTITVKGKFKINKKSRELVKGIDGKKAIIQLAAGQKLDIFDANA